MSVSMQIALSGQPLFGQPVMVKPSKAEKNLVQSTSAVSRGGGLGPYSGGARRLYVGNLPVTINEDQLRQVFEPFGTVELVQMPNDLGTGNCKGYAFIQLARLEDAKAAQNLNGQLEITGRVIKDYLNYEGERYGICMDVVIDRGVLDCCQHWDT